MSTSTSNLSGVHLLLAGLLLAAVTLLVRGWAVVRGAPPLLRGWWPLWADDRRARGIYYLVAGAVLLLAGAAVVGLVLML